jgi:hypothetical protein
MSAIKRAFLLSMSLLLLFLATTWTSHAVAKNTFSSPMMGWSSWSVQSSTRAGYGAGWLNEGNVKNAADAMNSRLKAAGYQYINLDSFWSNHFDGNGIPAHDTSRFPSGMTSLAEYIHARGLKMGIYWIVGLPKSVYSANYPIEGTGCHARDIAVQPLTAVNGWGSAWKINYNNPCAQAYINSIAKRFASWGVDLIKIDGFLDAATGPDAQAWSDAISNSGRKMWYTVSAWPVPISIASQATNAGNSTRINTDVECYCDTVAAWSGSVDDRWKDLPNWLGYLGPNKWPDLDAMPISNNTGSGIQDGINDVERQSVMTFWSMASSPLYIGGDLYFMDAKAVEIVTNPEVIAVNQSGILPTQMASGTTQIWKKVINGINHVAVYNLGSSAASFTVNWSSLGISGSASVRDLVSRSELGLFNGGWTASDVPAHGSRLVKVTPSGGSGIADKIVIAKTDARNIENLKVTTTFNIQNTAHRDYQDHGAFNQKIDDVLSGNGGTWNARANRWEGNFLALQSTSAGPPVLTINKTDSRPIANLRIEVQFTIGGAVHYDAHVVDSFTGTINLKLSGNGGTWNASANRWEGNFLAP